MDNEKIIIANWKMKLNLKETLELAKNIETKFKDFKKGEIAVCPNFISLLEVAKILKNSRISLGAQDVFWEKKGAYTGEISPSLLVEAGCKYVITGTPPITQCQETLIAFANGDVNDGLPFLNSPNAFFKTREPCSASREMRLLHSLLEPAKPASKRARSACFGT